MRVGGKRDRKTVLLPLHQIQTYCNICNKDYFHSPYQAFCCELRQLMDNTVWIIQDRDAAGDREQGMVIRQHISFLKIITWHFSITPKISIPSAPINYSWHGQDRATGTCCWVMGRAQEVSCCFKFSQGFANTFIGRTTAYQKVSKAPAFS